MQKPNNRRRITPIYNDGDVDVDDEVKVKIRDPFTALREEDAKLSQKKWKVESTTVVPLKVKEALKETTEKKVSLSEVLQRENLTLSELLNGDPKALSALLENRINRNFESMESVDLRRKETISNRMSLKPKLRMANDKNETGPIRMTIDLESTLTEQLFPEKLRNVTAKEELMEILKDPIGSERLARILTSRNMTLEELIEQRERGSSNLHLTDIFHSEKREPEPKILVFPTVKVVQKSRSFDSEQYTVTSFPTYKIEMEKPHPFFPIVDETSTDFDLQRIEDVENRIVEAATREKLLNVELLDENTSLIHTGVKSAILASAIIVGASLSVFLTIFVVFRWTQKQKRQRFNYCDSFTRIRAPILQMQGGGGRRSLRTFMTETLGRKKPFYQQNLQQSMSDVSWESDRKMHDVY